MMAVVIHLVFSTYVEVILGVHHFIDDYQCFLHVCGGDPGKARGWVKMSEFSPRMWR